MNDQQENNLWDSVGTHGVKKLSRPFAHSEFIHTLLTHSLIKVLYTNIHQRPMFSRLLSLIVVIAAFCLLAVKAEQNLRNELVQPSNAKVNQKRSLGDTAETYPTDPLGYASLWLSEFAYCPSGTNYMNLNFAGKADTQDFVPTAQFSVADDDSILGFIGHQHSKSAIWVAYRGSSDIENWITNLDFIRMSYPLCNGCSVHEGFYTAMLKAIADIRSAVAQLHAAYPSYRIVVTGHSLGAALATLTALDLAQTYGSGVKLYNYGCPRIFNDDGANWASSGVIDIVARRTHYRDPVPHLPGEMFGFHHTIGEIYENGPIGDYPNFPGGPLRTCSGEEDSDCADHWDGIWPYEFTTADHLLYSGVHMGSGGCQYL